MSFYKKYQQAWDDQDIGAMLDLYHPDYKRVFHAKGIEQGLSLIHISEPTRPS